jgi:phage terminase large subunit-like protein
MPTLTPTWVSDESVIPDPQGRAARMLAFADLLRHPKATGDDRRPLPHRWQRRIVEKIYGPSDASGRRQVSTVFALLPRGARKTTLASVLALGHTIGPAQTPGGQVVSAASDRTQARLAYDEAVSMILPDPRLVDATRIRDTKNRIEHKRSRSVYVAIAADGDAQHGKTPSFVLADELHVWRGYTLWNALKTGASKTPGSLTVIITTAGERPEGVCWELNKYAQRIAANPELDPSFLPIVFAADDKADWDDEALWHLVNPGLADGFPDLKELRSEAMMARILPRMRQAFKQTHLNIWADGSAANWVEMAVYDEAAAPIDLDALAGRPAWAGVDMSKSYDLTAIEVAFRDDDDGYIVLSFPFIPEKAFQRRKMELPDVPWQQWRDDKHLTVIPGEIIDDDVIEAKLRELSVLYDLQEIGFDPKFAAKIMSKLLDDGMPVIEVPQRPLILGPYYTEMQRAVIGRKFRHGGHPVLRWCFQNAVPIPGDTGLIYISKSRSTDAIDCLVGAAMALGRASAGDSSISLYATDQRPDGLLVLH